MAYIGNVPAEKYSALTQQTFSSPAGTSFTLDQSCTNSRDIALFIDNVRQNPASYTVSGTSLTTSTISSPSTMYCLFNGRTTETVNPPDDSVGTAKVSDNAITLAKMAGGTDGQVITYDASGDPVAVGPGTDGQVLTSTGAGSPPAFEDAGGGAFNLIASATASSSSSVEVTGMTTTYDSYLLLISRWIHANDNSQCMLTFSTASGYLSGSGVLCQHSTRVGSDSESYESNINSGVGSLNIPVGSAGNVGGEASTMSLWIHNATSNLAFPMISGTVTYMDDAGVAQGGPVIASFKAKQILTALKITPDAGTITSGRMSLYGIAHA